jgi:hypothetical protein
LFGLVDTYCGNTYYYENKPYANVWASSEACTADAKSDDRNPVNCRKIEHTSSGTCLRNFWRWDPLPDIMGNGYSGTFGMAATRRIQNILTEAGRGY